MRLDQSQRMDGRETEQGKLRQPRCFKFGLPFRIRCRTHVLRKSVSRDGNSAPHSYPAAVTACASAFEKRVASQQLKEKVDIQDDENRLRSREKRR